MFIDKSLRIALLISAVFHAVFFLQAPQFIKAFPIKEPLPVVTVTYLRTDLPPATKLREKENSTRQSPPKTDKRIQEPKLQEAVAVEQKKKVAQKPSKLLEPADRQEKIEIPPELPKDKEALYLDYYQTIRRRIRAFVIEDYPRFIACGEVCLRFVLLSNGELKELSVIDERSTSNHLLKEIAKKSLRRASPFVSFPEELKQRQLSFNVIISFELEE